MAKIKILSDSTCDLPKSLISKYEIGILPLYVNLGGTIYKDNEVDVTPKKIYDYVDKTGALPGTAGVSVGDFKEEFTKWHEQGYEIICHTISSDISCSYQSAKIAAEGMDGVWVIDTRNLSSGVGLLVLNSVEMAQKGMSAQEIVKSTEALIPNVSTTFIVDTVDYLKKGGRCSTLAALGANLLKIKPMIAVDKGSMKLAHKFRGPLKKVLQDYVDYLLCDKDNIDTKQIAITHTGCSEEILNLVADRIKKHIKFDNVIINQARATVTSHSGPNTLGLIFINK